MPEKARRDRRINGFKPGGGLMFYYPHHIGDYRSATAHLSNEEDLAYRRLLDMYYDTEQPIPLDTHWVARRLRVGSEVVLAVLKDFFVESADGWRSPRCDREIEEYRQRAERARANGMKGGRKPTGKKPARNQVGSQSEPAGAQDQTGSKANQEPETKNHEPSVPDGTKAPAALSARDLVADGLTEETAAEWLAHRKRVKAPMTPKAWAAIKAEAEAAGWPIEKAVLHSLANGWRGFNAEWVRSRGQPAKASAHSGFEERDYGNEDF